MCTSAACLAEKKAPTEANIRRMLTIGSSMRPSRVSFTFGLTPIPV
jgi:hypothetical protein